MADDLPRPSLESSAVIYRARERRRRGDRVRDYRDGVFDDRRGNRNIGLLLFTQSELDAAVSAGAEYAANSAAVVASNPSGLSTSISHIVNNVNGSAWATSTVNVNNGNDSTHCYCPTGTPGNWTWGSTVTCGSTCTGGGVGGQFVTITASSRSSFSPLFPGFGFVASGAISRSALVETQ